jgi:tetratricopeptide (TPR) repeat protein
MAYLGDLALHTRLPELAETHLQKALALEADNAMAHASLGVLRARQRRFAEAKEHLGRAVAADARNHLAHYYYAHTLSREGMDETGLVGGYTKQLADEMRAALAKAIKLKPDFAEAYHLIAFVNLVTGEQLDESIALLKRAIEITPGREEFALSLAQLHLRKQDFDAARKLIEPLARSSADARLRANAQTLLNNIANFEGLAARLRDSADASVDGGGGPPAPASGEGPPRLLTRSEGGRTPQPGQTTEEMMAEAFSETINEALRKPLSGEARAQGVLTRLECDAKGIVFHVRAGGRVLKLRSAGFDGLHIMAFTQEAGGQITCGARQSESNVVVTYRAASDARAKSDGEMVALEFVPAAFVLKQ